MLTQLQQQQGYPAFPPSQAAVQTPTETLAAIQGESLDSLSKSVADLDAVLSKLRGSQPTETGNIAKMPERSLLHESRDIRRLAFDISSRLAQIDSLLG